MPNSKLMAKAKRRRRAFKEQETNAGFDVIELRERESEISRMGMVCELQLRKAVVCDHTCQRYAKEEGAVPHPPHTLRTKSLCLSLYTVFFVISQHFS
jgi:hypothetical protein